MFSLDDNLGRHPSFDLARNAIAMSVNNSHDSMEDNGEEATQRVRTTQSFVAFGSCLLLHHCQS